VVAEVYRRLKAARDPGIFIHLRPLEDVLAEAEALGTFDPAASPLWGLPFAIKDNIDLAGSPTTAACPAWSYDPEQDAFVVARLRAAGALAIGKTNLDQFATGLVGIRTPYPVPRNAIDPMIPPGGSSAGSAVAVARGIVSFALGTDTAGSGRVPAALNNIVGLKPTLGALSAQGVVPACRTLDTISVFALTVADAWRVASIAAAHDPADAYSRPVQLGAPGVLPPRYRVGVPDAASIEFFGDVAQAASFENALESLEALGAQIVPVDFTPLFAVARMLYEGAWVAERYAVVQELIERDPGALHATTRAIIGSATRLSAADAFRGMYRLQELKRQAMPLIEACDLLCVPSIPSFVTLTDLAEDPIGPNSRLGTYTNFVNLMDLCALAVPVARRRDGRPGGVTLIAPAGRDAFIASVGAGLHAAAEVTLGATPALLPHVPRLEATAEPDEFRIAVVGAHLSGLPLNTQLTGLGARFLEASRTSSDYRLFRLPGEPPLRPGLVRDTSGGAAIELEVWALPSKAVGGFLAGIPAPLCIGTVQLQDGREVKGFLCEHSAVAGAEEITRFGGWRAYLAAR
jgi:allophanate hydrolase